MTAYEAALAALYARTAGGTRLGLERTAALLAAMGDPHLRFRSLHVAGTNGKGSVVAMLEAVLRERGHRVGAYTSPHLVDFRERVIVNGEPISEERVVRFADEWLPECDRIGATFFEATTALAFADFAERNVGIAVVETGLGGRLDSTNVLLPDVAAVTSVGLDHMDLLGDTLEEIAAEKAGIFKRGVPAVIGETDPVLGRLLACHAESAGASRVLTAASGWQPGAVRVAASGTSFGVTGDRFSQELRTNLIGCHQAANAVTALAILEAAGELDDGEMLRRGLTRVRLAGRFQRHGRFIFDVAHNPSAARALAETLAAVDPQRPVTGLISILGDKQWREVLGILAPALDHTVCTLPPSAPADRVWDAAAAAEAIRGLGGNAEAVPDFAAAIGQVSDSAGTVLVTGSFHTVGDAMARLQVNPLAA